MQHANSIFMFRQVTAFKRGAVTEVIKTTKLSDAPSVEGACLRAIHARADLRADGVDLVGSDKLMVEADVADFLKISASHLERFAAVQIFENCQNFSGYQCVFSVAVAEHSGLAKRIAELHAADVAMQLAKESRKVAGSKSLISSLEVC